MQRKTGVLQKASAKNVTLANCIQLWQMSPPCEYFTQACVIFRFIASRLRRVAARCADFKKLTDRQLLDFQYSNEVVATEFELFEVVREWVQGSVEGMKPGEAVAQELFSYARLELLERDEMQQVLVDRNILPKSVLCKHLERTTAHAKRVRSLPPPHSKRKRGLDRT